MDQSRFLYLQGFNPADNLTLDQLRALEARLARLNFPVGRVYVITTPRVAIGQPAGSEEINLADLPADVPADMAMNFYLDFSASGTTLAGHNAGRMLATLGKGDLAGFRQVHGMLNPGDVYGWVNHLLGVRGVVQAVQAVLNG